MTLNDLAQRVATEFGEQYGDPEIAEQYRTWAQETLDEIALDSRWMFRNASIEVVPVIGQAEYTLDVTIDEVKAVYLTQSGVARPGIVAYHPKERLLARGLNPTDAGTPEAWWYSGIDAGTTALKITVYKVPDAAFVTTQSGRIILDVIKRPSVLASSDTVPLPPAYILVAYEGIRFRSSLNEGEEKKAEAYFARFNDRLSKLNRRYHGDEGVPSGLRIKRTRAIRQAPASPEA